MHRVNGDDIRVLQLSEGLRFTQDVRRYFQGNITGGQITLLSEVNPAKGAAAEFRQNAKAEKLLPGLRHSSHGPGQPFRRIAIGPRFA